MATPSPRNEREGRAASANVADHDEGAGMKQESTTALRFWIVNTASWSLYTAFNLFLTATYVGWASGVVFISVALGVGLWSMSGVLRAVALRQRWFERGAAA